jgi:hypothetical protein
VHTLLLNTLPAPVVKDIAQGHSAAARRQRVRRSTPRSSRHER